MVQVVHAVIAFDDGGLGQVILLQPVTVKTERGRQTLDEVVAHVVEVHAVLRALRPSQSRLDGGEVELEHIGVGLLRLSAVVPQALCAAVGFDTGHVLGFAAGQVHVLEGAVVHGEEAARRAVLGRHVGDGGPIGQRKRNHACAEEFDELADHAVLTQHFDDAQRHVGRGHAGVEFADQAHTDHVGREHVDRLAEHHGFGLDAADTPAENAETVDHRRVRVGADQGVRQPDAVFLAGHGGEEFQVHLVHDAAGRRHSTEVSEALLTPLEEGVALRVTVVLDVEVEVERVSVGTGHVHLNGVIDDQIHGHLRVDALGVTAHLHHRVTKGREVNHGGHAGEILEDHPRGTEGNLATLAIGGPAGNGAHVFLADEETVEVAQRTLEEHAHAVRKCGGVHTRSIEGVEGVVMTAVWQFAARGEGVDGRHGCATERPSITARMAPKFTRRRTTANRRRPSKPLRPRSPDGQGRCFGFPRFQSSRWKSRVHSRR